MGAYNYHILVIKSCPSYLSHWYFHLCYCSLPSSISLPICRIVLYSCNQNFCFISFFIWLIVWVYFISFKNKLPMNFICLFLWTSCVNFFHKCFIDISLKSQWKLIEWKKNRKINVVYFFLSVNKMMTLFKFSQKNNQVYFLLLLLLLLSLLTTLERYRT